MATEHAGASQLQLRFPKPLHGWRALLGEVGIIVVGVLIALGAGQLVEEVTWRAQVNAGRDALRDEYITILENAAEREMEDECIRGRLASLVHVLDAGGGTLPPSATSATRPEEHGIRPVGTAWCHPM